VGALGAGVVLILITDEVSVLVDLVRPAFEIDRKRCANPTWSGDARAS
jgi:hypothetical protein